MWKCRSQLQDCTREVCQKCYILTTTTTNLALPVRQTWECGIPKMRDPSDLAQTEDTQSTVNSHMDALWEWMNSSGRYHGWDMDALREWIEFVERYQGCHMDALWEWIEFAGTLSWLGHGCSVGLDRVCGWSLLERYHDCHMDALVATVCSRNTNVIMVWAWMLWQPYALGTRTLSCFGHGRSGNRMLSEHERYHALGMDALATVCSRNTNVIMLWAWAQCQPYALGTRTLSCFGHGRSGNRMLSEHELYHGLGMNALATVCSWNTNVIMLWAWAQCQPYALGTRTLSWEHYHDSAAASTKTPVFI